MPVTYNGVTTTITNSSGGTRVLSYLPPHGKTLAPGGTFVYQGILADSLNRQGVYKRKLAAYQADIAAGRITVAITYTP